MIPVIWYTGINSPGRHVRIKEQLIQNKSKTGSAFKKIGNNDVTIAREHVALDALRFLTV